MSDRKPVNNDMLIKAKQLLEILTNALEESSIIVNGPKGIKLTPDEVHIGGGLYFNKGIIEKDIQTLKKGIVILTAKTENKPVSKSDSQFFEREFLLLLESAVFAQTEHPRDQLKRA